MASGPPGGIRSSFPAPEFIGIEPAIPDSDMMLTIEIDGHAIVVREGISLAAALLNHGVYGFRRSVSGDPRGPLCGMGSCHECRVTIDGREQQRSCLVPVREGMRVVTGG